MLPAQLHENPLGLNRCSLALRTRRGRGNLNGMDTLDQLGDSGSTHEPQFESEFLRQILTKVVIQEQTSRLYLSQERLWTQDFENATAFDSRQAARWEIAKLKLQNVRLVLNWEIE